MVKKVWTRSSKLYATKYNETVDRITNGFSNEGQDYEDEKGKSAIYLSGHVKDKSK